ncbi:hypothetical protein PENSPDRAFT_646981 [Peniophora sp. CONT]|nr:hypothetical protein PENSPDRAFT_646981 [Peniophora sp. CONT]
MDRDRCSRRPPAWCIYAPTSRTTDVQRGFIAHIAQGGDKAPRCLDCGSDGVVDAFKPHMCDTLSRGQSPANAPLLITVTCSCKLLLCVHLAGAAYKSPIQTSRPRILYVSFHVPKLQVTSHSSSAYRVQAESLSRSGSVRSAWLSATMLCVNHRYWHRC